MADWTPGQRQGGEATAVYALTAQGARLGRVLAGELSADLFLPDRLAQELGGRGFESLLPLVGRTFRQYGQHVFVAAAGIVVRAIAPHLRCKAADPAVVVLDQRGRFAVSLVSGHLGGANALARRVAAFTAGQAVVTTASDVEEVPSLDDLARERGMAIADTARIRPVSVALLAGDPVQVFDPGDLLGLADSAEPWAGRLRRVERLADWAPGLPGVAVSHELVPDQEGMLLLRPACICLGLGCRKGASAAEIEAFIRESLEGAGLALASVSSLGSIRDKESEPGLLAAAAALGKGLFFFDAAELKSVEVPNPSPVVESHMGVSSVCEAAALLLSGAPELLLEKRSSGRVTLAAALCA